MGVIGKNNTTDVGGTTIATTDAQKLLKAPQFIYTPTEAEVVSAFGFFAAAPAGGTMDISVYDVTDGIDNAILMGSQSVAGAVANAANEDAATTTISLEPGKDYAISFKASADVTTNVGYLMSGSSFSSIDGTSPFASEWDDASNDDSQWSVYALTEAGAPTPSVSITGPLQPGASISGTYSNFAAAPTALTLTDSGDNSISSATEITDLNISDNGDGTGSFTFTMPGLPAAGNSQSSLLFGDVTAELTT